MATEPQADTRCGAPHPKYPTLPSAACVLPAGHDGEHRDRYSSRWPDPEPPVVATPQEIASGVKTCPQCAEDIKAAALVCRFCGHRFDATTVQAPPPPIVAARPRTPPRETASPRTSGAAVAAFICSVLGLWIVSIPLGIHARREVDRSNGLITGRGFGTAGVVLGVLGLIATIILIVAVVHAANSGCTYTYIGTGACAN